MKILTIDTSRAICATMFKNATESYELIEAAEKGAGELLINQIQQLQLKSNWGFEQIEQIVVNIGPGSFTGIRLGVAAARSFALALDIPVVGISILTVLARIAQNHTNKDIAVIIPAFAQHYTCFTIAAKASPPEIYNIKSAQILAYDPIVELAKKYFVISSEAIIKSDYTANASEILQAFDFIARCKDEKLDLPAMPIYMQPYKCGK